ncbi:hypothetical protein EV360DRAFT_54449, partial [Lentinula raphanica]
PQWFRSSFKMANEDFGPAWCTLLELWLTLEHGYNFQDPKHGLRHLNRPTELSEWMKKERPVNGVMIYSKEAIVLFADRFWIWWNALQPSWRATAVSNRPGSFDAFGTVWVSLDKPGRNGWFGLIICLKWWRSGLNNLSQEEPDKPHLEEDWMAAVKDVGLMLDGLVQWRRTKALYPSLANKAV